jgi:hypothetical protein
MSAIHAGPGVRHRNCVRLPVIGIAVAVAASLLSPSSSAAGVAVDQIRTSASPQRSAAQVLAGARMSGAQAIFVDAVPGTRSVAFYLDGATAPSRVENLPPFDFAGTAANGAALLTGAGALKPGGHTLKAVRTFSNGDPAVTLTAPFTVSAALPSAVSRVVTRCGAQLCLDRTPWRLNGGSTNGNPTNGQTPDGNIALALQLRVNTIRLTDFLAQPGRLNSHEYEESQWVGVDRMIAKAAANHLKVELDLSTYRNFLESQSATFNPYTYDWTKFLTFVANRRNTVSGVRYGSDSTIALVSFAGEAEAPSHTYSKNRGVTATQLVAFYNKVLTLWGQLAPQQLRTPGGLYFLTDTTMPWRQIFSLPGCDVIAVHSYSLDDEQSQPAVAALGRQLGKPWILEEFGFSAADHPTDIGRAAAFDRQYNLGITHGAAGVSWWNIDPAAIAAAAYPRTMASIQAKNAGPAVKR